MNTKTKKTTIVLVAVLAISLVAGNVLFAANDSFTGRDRGSGLIDTTDIEMVSTSRSASESAGHVNSARSSSSSPQNGQTLVSAQDIDFVSQPFASDRSRTWTSAGSNDREPAPGLVSAGDVRFVNGGNAYGANMVCVVDGIQVSGKQCIN